MSNIKHFNSCALPGIQKKRIVILIPLVWAIRNIVHAGVLDHLVAAGLDVFLLLHKYDDVLSNVSGDSFFAKATSCQSLIPPRRKRHIIGIALLKEVISNAFSRRNSISSYTIYQRWFGRRNVAGKQARNYVVSALGYFAQPSLVFDSLCRLRDWLYCLEYDLTLIQKQLNTLKPDAVLSTVNVEDTYERAYVLSAKKLGIPVINSILSFDNLTSKPAHLVYDYYLVWNQGMKDQLIRFYPQVRADRVSITGTPQFDFHRRAKYVWSRGKTLEKLGLPCNARYFLYGASTKSLTPDEPELVGCLLRKMQANPFLRDYWLVVRTHPRDEWSRWKTVLQDSQKVMLSNSWDRILDTHNGWAVPAIDDYARLTSSLVHGEACLNIASTISFDAAILDRPVIGIRFDHELDAPREILYEEYDTDHYRPLVESGGLRLAHTWHELLALMVDAIQHPDRDRDVRARMVSQECGLVDGHAVHRVADALLDYLGKIHEG